MSELVSEMQRMLMDPRSISFYTRSCCLYGRESFLEKGMCHEVCRTNKRPGDP